MNKMENLDYSKKRNVTKIKQHKITKSKLCKSK